MKLSKSLIKTLEIIAKHPGLRWYEVGIVQYPRSARGRVNVFGRNFVDLSGPGASSVNKNVCALKQAKLTKSDKDHRHFITPKGKRALQER